MKTLLIYLKNNQQFIIHFKGDDNKLDKVLKAKKLSRDDILIIKELNNIPLAYQHSFVLKDNKLELDKNLIIENKIKLIREKRDELLKSLDIPYMIANETNNVEKKKTLGFQRQVLRDIPNKINLHNLSIENIFKFNPFYNLVKVEIEDAGEGYDHPPILNIDAPQMFGKKAQIVSVIENGKIKEINILDSGYGYYFNTPNIYISSSNSGKPAKLIAIIENRIDF